MNKEATIKSALIPFLKDADIRKAMDIFHKDYADITPYQIQRFVHEITQDNPTKEYRSNIRRSLMKALSDYQMGAAKPQPITHDIPDLGQNSAVIYPSTSQVAIANQKYDSVSSPIFSQTSSQIAVGLTEKRKAIYEKLGISLPQGIEGDALLDSIITVFVIACRERRYSEGQPLPISTSDITAVLQVRSVNMSRWLLDDIIFEIDAIALDEVKRLQKAK